MREKLLLAAILTLTLRLFAGLSWSFSTQETGTINWLNSRVMNMTELKIGSLSDS